LKQVCLSGSHDNVVTSAFFSGFSRYLREVSHPTCFDDLRLRAIRATTFDDQLEQVRPKSTTTTPITAY
jgi:hypothetical protein